MTDVHQYYGIENIALTNGQRNTLVAALQALGRNNGGVAHERNHWAIRPDNQAVIFEAVFDTNDLTIATMKQRLATIFGVSVASIDSATAAAPFGAGTTQVVTFSRLGVDYIRACVFGGLSATWAESKVEALAYLALPANIATWGDA